jgi:hypothetical protein
MYWWALGFYEERMEQGIGYLGGRRSVASMIDVQCLGLRTGWKRIGLAK